MKKQVCCWVVGLGVFISAVAGATPIQQISVEFLGAAGTVGGACFLVEADGYRFLIDCGDFYAEEGEARGWRPPVDCVPPIPLDITAIILTHAHQDHWGRVPELVLRQGWRGKIFLTGVTQKLLADCELGILRNQLGYLDMGPEPFLYTKRKYSITKCEKCYRETGKATCVVHSCPNCPYARRIKEPGNLEITRPELERYGFRVCRKCCELETRKIAGLFKKKAYGELFEVVPGVRARFLNAGHMPGSAMVLLEFEVEGGPFRVLFSGDVGPGSHPFVLPPASPTLPIDVLVIETTYGDRVRDESYEGGLACFQQELAKAIRVGHRVVIPVFALDRAQRVLYEVGQCKAQECIPMATPIFLGGSAIQKYTNLYRAIASNPKRFQDGVLTSDFFSEVGRFGSGVYFFDEWNGADRPPPGPCIVLATSADGRCSVLGKWMAALLEDPDTDFFLVAYADPDSPSGQLWCVSRGERDEVKLDDRAIKVDRKRVHGFKMFSGHADAAGLKALVESCHELGGLNTVFLVHGELEAMEAFKKRLEQAGLRVRIEIPALGQCFQVFPQVRQLWAEALDEGALAAVSP